MTSLAAPQPAAPTQAAAEAGAEGVCAHCGLALPPAASRFCCAGCAAAYELVTRLGLGQFYARRSEPAAAPAGLDEEQEDGAVLP
ncbi:MAG: heavy metal translocating P-type ATPase metal-binding domain-containing protein, partial [Thiohalocapsa sp.]